MTTFSQYEFWFVTGSQHPYGDETLQQAADHAQTMVRGFNNDPEIPASLICQPAVTTPEEIEEVCRKANSSPHCLGLMFWMHTFSPEKMWIRGLAPLNKPFAHLHTQYNRDIPWDRIYMDFMNLNQLAHGDSEFGFIVSRMDLNRSVIVGHGKNPRVRLYLARWCRAARARETARTKKVARFGDNMRDVAVTEGDKVASQIDFGFPVNGYALGDLAEAIRAVPPGETDKLVSLYADTCRIESQLLNKETSREQLKNAAAIELGMQSFLESGDFSAFTTTFENLHGLKQFPGLAVQRLMADGYGFGAEGDWKTAAFTRIMKLAGEDLHEGSFFMEDYTCHLEPGNMQVLGAHMPEVCPSIASSTPSPEIYELGIGGKQAPVRLVFSAAAGCNS